MKTFDYIVVGGGSAGSVMAGRLSEDPRRSVLLIEAGGPIDGDPRITTPARFGEVVGSERDWHITDNPRGKVMGGCSSMNACIYMRGNPDDYDRWPHGWRFKDLLPFFKKAENSSRIPDKFIPNRDMRGFDGPMNLTMAGANGHQLNVYSQRFIQGCVEQGYPFHPDINGLEDQFGVAPHQFNIAEGIRQTTDLCYLAQRENLTITTDLEVDKIIFEGTKAVGVRCSHIDLRANREIVVCAGAVGSPWILMRSGIGRSRDLSHHGIDSVADLPVGYGLQDHLMSPVIFETAKDFGVDHQSQAMKKQYDIYQSGDLAETGLEVSLFARSGFSGNDTDLQITLLAGIPPQIARFIRILMKKDTFHIPQKGFVAFPVLGTPESRGTVRLDPDDPTRVPIVSYDQSENPKDTKTMIEAFKIMRRIVASQAFKELEPQEVLDPDIQAEASSDEYIAQYLKHASSQGHLSGTCALGQVVDHQLRVKGVEGLRVVDASVIPTIPNGNIHATVVAVAEKGADLIKGPHINFGIDSDFMQPAFLGS